MRQIIAFATIALSACSTAPPATTATPVQGAAPRAAAQAVASEAPPVGGLNDLDAVTLGCPKAGLNAAAREAAKARAQGRYQFSYFKMISDSHHSLYEVHFKSNHHEDPDLKYCVSVYCQQGWDPKTTKTSVDLMGVGPKPDHANAAGAGHGAHCGSEAQTRVKKRSKR